MHQTGTFVSTLVFAEIIMVDYWGPLSENHGEEHNKDLSSKHNVSSETPHDICGDREQQPGATCCHE